MDDVWLAGGAHLPLVVLDAELPGLANQVNIFAGSVGLNMLQKRLEALVDGGLIQMRWD